MPTTHEKTSTEIVSTKLPKHVAIIMDGNGRWAKKRFMPRFMGHKAGVETVRDVVRACAKKGIDVLTLFAFSSENWRRPKKEVSLLLELLTSALHREVKKLDENNVQLKIIGDRSVFGEKLLESIENAEQKTAHNTGLSLVIAVNYGGRWDITQAVQSVAQSIECGELKADQVDEELLGSRLSMHGLPVPDLFIRTGGEQRVSNFILWQLAYAEMYFTDTLWPDFDDTEFDLALASFTHRERRYGRTSEQVGQVKDA